MLKTKLGTYKYMAPELHNNEKYNGAAVDIFAAGMILFIMLTGFPPFTFAVKSDSYYHKIMINREDKFWN